MQINKLTGQPYVPIMGFNTIHGITVGADLSGPSPIHRPSVAFHDIPVIVLNHIIGPNKHQSTHFSWGESCHAERSEASSRRI